MKIVFTICDCFGKNNEINIKVKEVLAASENKSLQETENYLFNKVNSSSVNRSNFCI